MVVREPQGASTAHSERALERLAELVRRVNSSTQTNRVLDEITNGVCQVLGYGVAAISQLEGDTLVMVAVAGPEEVRRRILGRRTPARDVLDEFRTADHWGILRYVPHGRMDQPLGDAAWIPDFEPSDEPDAWHPEDALYAPLYSATGELLGNMSVDLPPGLRIPSPSERELLEMFVVQAGLALSNAQQRERLSRQLRLGGIVKEVAQAATEIGLEAMLDVATEVIKRGFNAQGVLVRCVAGGDRGREVGRGHPAIARTNPAMGALLADLAETSWPQRKLVTVTLDDTTSDLLPASLPVVQAAMQAGEAGPVHLGVIAPIGVGQELCGYLGIGFAEGAPHPLPDEMAAITEIARELGRMVQSARLFETEQQLVTELRELDRYKGELIATISHELKTPLTTIIGHVELLEDAEVLPRSVQAIRRNADRLDRLIHNLLDYAQVQARRGSVRRCVDLVALVDSAIDLLSQQAESGGVQVTFDRPALPCTVTGDPEELATVLNNLIGNAVKYTRPGGGVEVAVRSENSTMCVTVTDTGIGISKADRAHLFTTFHRSSNPEALSLPGTGLGLAIAWRIAQEHGGRIEVESELGRGSIFRLVLPVPVD